MDPSVDWLAPLMALQGAQCAGLVDCASGLLLDSKGEHPDWDAWAHAHANWLRQAQHLCQVASVASEERDAYSIASAPVEAAMEMQALEEILVTMGNTLHVIRPLKRLDGLMLSMLLERPEGNAALAQRAMREVEMTV